MAIGIVMLVISMGTRPFMPNLTLVTILEFFNGVGSVIDYITPFLLREYYEVEYSEVMASVNYFCSKHFSSTSENTEWTGKKDNPEKLATLDTQDAGRKHTKQKTHHSTQIMLIKYGPSYKQLEENTNRTLFYVEIAITINILYTWVLKANETMMTATSGTDNAYLSGSAVFILNI
jgi:hypothetical protein